VSSKIKILDASLTELATIALASSASRIEKINSDNLLNFSVRVKSGYGDYIADDAVFDLDGDYFDLAYCKKEQQGDGRLMISVECEHVSYRLNNAAYNVDYFTEIGTPTAILTEILSGTGFTVGTVDFATSMTFSLQEATSRRALLMQFAAYVGGELEFSGFTISLLTQRGSATPTALTVGKDITVMSKAVDKRKLDGSGNPIVSYTCGVYKGASLALGDVVTLDYDALGISTSLRVVSKSYDPYNPNNVSVEIGNYVNSLEDDLYRIETDMVAKGKTYYGAKISADNGFESIRSDNLARAVFNADLFSMQVWDEVLESWKDKIYFDPATGKYVFDGTLSATVIEAVNAEVETVVSNTFITQTLYAGYGRIADLTVSALSTEWQKAVNYLNSDTSDVCYQKIYEDKREIIISRVTSLPNASNFSATAASDVQIDLAWDNPTELSKEQLQDINSNDLYWTDDTHTAMSTEVTSYPVYIYSYEDVTKFIEGTELIDGVYIPYALEGGGDGITSESGKVKRQKKADGYYITYYKRTSGDPVEIALTDNGVTFNNTGATSERPSAPSTGQQWFDTTIGIPIWHNGTNWVDASGTTV